MHFKFSGVVADIQDMNRDYQQMGSEERQRHHDELRDDGYEWCPDCGGILVWELPRRGGAATRAESVPFVSGDCPPLTAELLLATIPYS